VKNGSSATVTCSLKPGAVWPDAGFYVDVAAEAVTSLIGCSDRSTTRRQLSIIKKPEVSIILSDEAPGSVKQVCNNATYVSLGYTVSSGASGFDVTLITANVTTAEGGALTSVTCSLPVDPTGESVWLETSHYWPGIGT
jgi:hypothetical protein